MVHGEREIRFREKIDEITRISGAEIWVNSDLCEIRFFIERKIENLWNEIGYSIVIIDENHMDAKIGDLLIGSRNGRYVLHDENRPRPKNIDQYSKLRGKGIGTKVVTLILRRLKRHGIKRVYGFLSDADDRVKAINFWLKLGFARDGDELTKKL